LKRYVFTILSMGVGVLAGCAPALSSFTPAHVAKHKHVQAELGMDVSIPTGSLSALMDAGEVLANGAEERELTEAEQEKLFQAGAALALNPPSATPHIGVGYTLLERLELNGRYSIGAWRLGARYQILEQARHEVDLTVGLGGARYVYEFPIKDQIPVLTLEDFTRWQVDVPLLVGQHGDWYRWWGGPRALFTFYGTELTFHQPAIPGILDEEKAVLGSLDGSGNYLGGQLGGALGYKYVFFAFELTIAKFWTDATLKVLDREREVSIDSWIIYPGFALLGEF
jgi:hypothetical protein